MKGDFLSVLESAVMERISKQEKSTGFAALSDVLHAALDEAEQRGGPDSLMSRLLSKVISALNSPFLGFPWAGSDAWKPYTQLQRFYLRLGLALDTLAHIQHAKDMAPTSRGRLELNEQATVEIRDLLCKIREQIPPAPAGRKFAIPLSRYPDICQQVDRLRESGLTVEGACKKLSPEINAMPETIRRVYWKAKRAGLAELDKLRTGAFPLALDTLVEQRLERKSKGGT